MDTWCDRHSGWEIKRWDESDAKGLRNQRLFSLAEEIAGPHANQFKSDILRYEILEVEGGVYVDCDFECRLPIDDLVRSSKPGFAAWERQGVWLNNAFMGAVPYHPAITKLIDELEVSVNRRQPGSRPNIYSGPQFFTPIALAHASMFSFLPQAWFYPYAYNELHRQGEDFDGAYAVHHWNNQRRKHGLVEA